MITRDKPISNILSIKLGDIIHTTVICFYVLFDSINGFFIGTLGVHLPISVSIKLLILSMSLMVVLRCKAKLTSFLSIVLVFVVPIIIRSILFSQDYFLLELNYVLKYVSFLIFVYYFYDYYSRVKDCYKIFYRMVYISYVIVVLNVSLGFIGVGGYTYPNTNTGFKGFFIAGNELSALFILFTILIYGKFIEAGQWVVSSLFMLFSIFISICIGTKSSILLLTLTFVLYPLYAKLIIGQWKSSIKLFIMLLFSIVLFGGVFYQFGSIIQTISTIERVLYKLDSHDVINAIFSGREIWLSMYINYLYEHGVSQSIYLSMIFGPGFYFSTKATQGKLLIESDLVDLYSLSGLIGMSVVIVITVYFACIIFSSRDKLKFWKEALYVHLALTFIAVFFGHVWTSGMLSVAYASVIGLSFSQRVGKC